MAGSFSDILFRRAQRIYNDPSQRQHVHQEVLGWIADHDRKLPLAELIAESFGEYKLPALTHPEDCVIVAALHDRRAQKVGSGTFVPSGSIELREDQGPVERVAVSVALTWETACDKVGRLLDNLCGPARHRLRGDSLEDDQDECERVEQFFCSVFQRVETRLGIVDALSECVQTRNRAHVQVNQSVQNDNHFTVHSSVQNDNRVINCPQPAEHGARPINANEGTTSGDRALVALLRVLTNGVADDRIKNAIGIVKDARLTVNEKMNQIDDLIRIPPTASGEQLGKMLGVSKQAVFGTDWWIQNRKGKRQNEVACRVARHKERAKLVEPPGANRGDEAR